MAWYVKFDGIAGGSSNRHHFTWCNAASVNIGGHKAGGGGTGVGRVGGKMHLEVVSIGIIDDRALPKLIEAAVKGHIFPKVQIHGTAIHKAAEQVYLEIELQGAEITSYQLGVLDNNAATDDLSLTLNFAAYKSLFRDFERGGATTKFNWALEPGEG